MKIIILSICSFLLVLLLYSCSSAPEITKVTSLVPLTDADKKITKSGMTIKVVPISLTNLSQFPVLSTTAKIMTKGILDSKPYPKEIPVPNVLADLSFALKITNNTGHIVRMVGSEVGITIGGQDVPKLSIEQIKQLWVAFLAEHYEYQVSVPVEVTSALSRLPYWNENLKVLPGKSIEAFISFDYVLSENIGNVTLAIYDLVTNTDEAGNPTERTNFDFNFKEITTKIKSE